MLIICTIITQFLTLLRRKCAWRFQFFVTELAYVEAHLRLESRMIHEISLSCLQPTCAELGYFEGHWSDQCLGLHPFLYFSSSFQSQLRLRAETIPSGTPQYLGSTISHQILKFFQKNPLFGQNYPPSEGNHGPKIPCFAGFYLCFQSLKFFNFKTSFLRSI